MRSESRLADRPRAYPENFDAGDHVLRYKVTAAALVQVPTAMLLDVNVSKSSTPLHIF